MKNKQEDAFWLKPLLAFWLTTLFVPLGCFAIYLLCDPPNISVKHILWWWPHVGVWYVFVGGVCGIWGAFLTYFKEKQHPDPDEPD